MKEKTRTSLVEANIQPFQGVAIAAIILSVWMISLVMLLSADLSKSSPWLMGLALLWQTFLYSGLFITAHDAMHGAVFPMNARVNNAIGSFAVFVYGLFSYRELFQKHWLHHKHPSTELDPDFHDGRHTNFFSWYFYFMQRYWSWSRILGLIVLFHSIHYFLHISELNLSLFWVFPSIFSSMQLFYFGTFLTHREPDDGYTTKHRARSTTFSTFWSFITCYHFGYHHEHHEYPHLPWWKLPEVYRLRLEDSQ
ncbi:MAG: fatty acid desaturase [Oculatellaceae cyanobacterium bins.114]|nr:fatty acid desaturase [Oculatellaceae cyanobacterium bins.114]